MDNAIRWIFCLVTVVLLLYACALCSTTCRRLDAAGRELAALEETEQALREENEKLSRLLASEGRGSG